MKKAGFGVLAASLALGIGAAVSTLLAQTPAPAPLPDPAPSPRMRELRMLDGRGSRLGVTVQDLAAEDLKSTSGVTSGVKIEDVAREGAAAKAGLQEGDVVVEFDGERVRSARQFSRLVQETPDGQTVKMGIVRGGQKQTIDVTPDRNMARSLEIDSDRIRRDVERSLRGLDRLPYFNFEGRPFAFDWDEGMASRTPRGRLGVQLDSLTPQLAEYFGATDGGVLVSGVTPGSPAEKAGLKAGDVIVSINGARVQDVNDIRSELRESPSTDLSIGIVRDKKETTLKGAIPER